MIIDREEFQMDLYEFYEKGLHIKSPRLRKAAVQLTEMRAVPKETFLLHAGAMQTEVYFLVDGIARGFFLDINGHELTDYIIFQYAEPVMPVANLDSPSTENIETLTPCTLACLPLTGVRQMLKHSREVAAVYNRLLSKALERHWMLKSIRYQYTAAQRYEWFLKAYPGVIDQIGHKYVASFLNMTPVTLSRIRKSSHENQG